MDRIAPRLVSPELGDGRENVADQSAPGSGLRETRRDARIEADAGGAIITFANDVRAVSKGQIAVFYEGDRVLGGGRIC